MSLHCRWPIILLALGLCLLAAGVPTSTARFTGTIQNTGNSVTTASAFTCQAAAVASGAYYAYPLDDPPTNLQPARDVSGAGRTGTYRNTATHSGSSPCVRDGGGSTTFNGSSTQVSTPDSFANPQVFSVETWFRTSGSRGGVLFGFASTLLGLPLAFDRNVYLTNAGRIVFGVQAGGSASIISPSTYNDGAWHLLVATLGPAGMRLYVDGAVVVRGPVTTAQGYTGYWWIANGTLTGWANAPSSTYFSGQLGYAAIYTRELSSAEVRTHDAAGR